MIIVSVSVYLLPESINNPAKRIRHTFMNNEVEMKEMSDKKEETPVIADGDSAVVEVKSESAA